MENPIEWSTKIMKLDLVSTQKQEQRHGNPPNVNKNFQALCGKQWTGERRIKQK